MKILKTQLTLLILIALGLLGRKTGLFNEKGKTVLANLLYYFLLPSLFITQISKMDLTHIHPPIIFGSLLPIAALMLILLILTLVSIISRDTYIILNLSICFGSNAFFGIPFFTNLYGMEGQEFSVLTATIFGIFGIVWTTIFFEFSSPQKNLRASFLKLVKNPIILSILIGIVLSLFKIRLSFIENPLTMLAQASGSLSIIILGMFLYDNVNLASLKKALLYGLFRFFALPLVTITIVLLFFNTPGSPVRFLIIQSGIPVAISIAVFSEKYNWKQDIIPNIVIITSILSFISLTILYFFTNSILTIN